MEEYPTGHVLAGRFRIESRLGAGGMGSVYAAEELSSGRTVALKVLNSELVEDARFVERFRREAEATARLEHPNIVRVTEFVHTVGEPALIVMERLRGEPLLARVRRGPMALKQALRVAEQLTAALAAAHRAGVVHRDLKPANVFLVPLAHGGSMVKLLDFGIAKLRESDGYHRLTQTGILIGTPRYASPEQVMGSKRIDARSDVFSLGVLLYGMLAGRPPFRQKGAALLVAIRHELPPPLESVSVASPAVAAVVRTAMAKLPEDRFESMEAFEAALSALSASLAGDSLAVPGPTLVDRAPVVPAPVVLADEPRIDGPRVDGPRDGATMPVAPSRHARDAASAAQAPPALANHAATVVLVPRTPTRGTPRQALPVALASPPAVPPGNPSAPHGRPSRPSAPHGRVSRPSAPDATPYGPRGSAAKTSVLPRILMVLGGLLVSFAVLGLAFVGAGFWLRGQHVEPDVLVERDVRVQREVRERVPGALLPGVDYLASRAATELGEDCRWWEYQACACMTGNLAQTARCRGALSVIREAAASGSARACAGRITPQYDCAGLARPTGALERGSSEWSAWATLRATQLGPSCSTLLNRTCGCDGAGTANCLVLQEEFLQALSNDSVRQSLFVRCREVPDFEEQSCP